MSFSAVISAAMMGLKVEIIQVEADVSNGLPAFQMVGYLSSEVKEAAERVRTAIRNSHMEFPSRRVVINLSPATVRKRGSAFDLPIAVSILASLGRVPEEAIRGKLLVGELGLDGKVQPVAGVLPMVLEARAAGISGCIVPRENAAEGALVEGMHVIGVKSLEETISCLQGEKPLPVSKRGENPSGGKIWDSSLDYGEMVGQETVKRGAEVAAAGGHNLLLIGPPGSGKSMTARRLPSILPPMTMEESMEVTKIYSILGRVDGENPLVYRRPFRSVHHTATKTALVGGGALPMPGEISLAHHGVLFMDELPEFSREVLEVLRQPLEEREIRIARSYGNFCFPANFMLVAAMNPCPCGGYPDRNRCTCTPEQIHRYLGKISQPFLDRMDLCVEAPRVEYEALQSREKQEDSGSIRERVCKARERQNARYAGTGIQSNALLGVEAVKKYCQLAAEEEALMKKAFSALHLTARTYHKILKVARTIADLDDQEQIQKAHLLEAIGYRSMDKKYWGR